MSKPLIEIVNLDIASGSATGTAKITPRSGLIIGCAVYHNDATNPGVVQASFKTADGDELIPLVHIEHLRSREAGYREGLVPLYVEANGKSYNFSVIATDNFAAAFTAQLVLVYENDFTKENNC